MMPVPDSVRPLSALALPSCSLGAISIIRPSRAGPQNASPVPTRAASAANSQT